MKTALQNHKRAVVFKVLYFTCSRNPIIPGIVSEIIDRIVPLMLAYVLMLSNPIVLMLLKIILMSLMLPSRAIGNVSFRGRTPSDVSHWEVGNDVRPEFPRWAGLTESTWRM